MQSYDCPWIAPLPCPAAVSPRLQAPCQLLQLFTNMSQCPQAGCLQGFPPSLTVRSCTSWEQGHRSLARGWDWGITLTSPVLVTSSITQLPENEIPAHPTPKHHGFEFTQLPQKDEWIRSHLKGVTPRERVSHPGPARKSLLSKSAC